MFKETRELKVFLVRKVIRVMTEVRSQLRDLLHRNPISQLVIIIMVMDISRLIRVIYMFGMVVLGLMLEILLDHRALKASRV